MSITKALRILFVSICLFAGSKPVAQINFLDADTAVWRYRGFVVLTPVCLFYDDQLMLSREDTVVNGHTYRKVFSLGHGKVYFDCVAPAIGSTSPNNPVSQLAGLIREEGRKVYYWIIGWDEEYLAYDFDQVIGDTVPFYQFKFPLNLEIISIEDTVLAGTIFKQYILKQPNGTIRDTFIEGIGTVSHPFIPDDLTTYTVELICYSRNDTVYYQRYDSCAFYIPQEVMTGIEPDLAPVNEIQVFPNPVFSGNDFLLTLPDQVHGKIPNITIYDPIGILVYRKSADLIIDGQIAIPTEGWKPGMYFIKTDGPSIGAKLIVY